MTNSLHLKKKTKTKNLQHSIIRILCLKKTVLSAYTLSTFVFITMLIKQGNNFISKMSFIYFFVSVGVESIIQ